MNYKDMSRDELRHIQSEHRKAIDRREDKGFERALTAIFGEEDAWKLESNTIFNEGEIFPNNNGVEYIVLDGTIGEETYVEARTKTRARYSVKAIRYLYNGTYEWRSSDFLGFYGD